MADNFDLRKYLAENKLTKNTPAYKGPEGYDDGCDCYPEADSLDEIGDASAKAFKWKAHPKTDWGGIWKGTPVYEYTFTTDSGTEYFAEFFHSQRAADEGKELYLFQFNTTEGDDDGGVRLTWEEVPLRIMSTVTQIVKDFLSKHPGTSIQYHADENFKGDTRRAKLYMAYIKNMLPSNYEVIPHKGDMIIQPKDSE